MSESNSESSSSGEDTEDEVPQTPALNLAGPKLVNIDRSQEVKIGNTININCNVVMNQQNSNQLLQAGPSGIAETDQQRILGELIKDAVAKALPHYLQQHGEHLPAVEFQHNGKSIQQLSITEGQPETSQPIITDPDDSSNNAGSTIESSHSNTNSYCDLQVSEVDKTERRLHNLLETSSEDAHQYNENPVNIKNKWFSKSYKSTVSNKIEKINTGAARTFSNKASASTTPGGKDKICIYKPLRILDGEISGKETDNSPKINKGLLHKNSTTTIKTKVEEKDQKREKICIYKPLRYVDFVEGEVPSQERSIKLVNSSADKSGDLTSFSPSTSSKSSEELKSELYKRIKYEDLRLLANVILQAMINYAKPKEFVSFEIPYDGINGFYHYTNLYLFGERTNHFDFNCANFTGGNNVQIDSITKYNITDDEGVQFNIVLILANAKVTFTNFCMKNDNEFTVTYYHSPSGTFSIQIPQIRVTLSVNFFQHLNEIHGQMDVECNEVNFSVADLQISSRRDEDLKKKIIDSKLLLESIRCYIKENVTRELQKVGTRVMRNNELICDIICNLLTS